MAKIDTWQTQAMLYYDEDEDTVRYERDYLRDKLENVLDFLIESGMSKKDIIEYFELDDYYTTWKNFI